MSLGLVARVVARTKSKAALQPVHETIMGIKQSSILRTSLEDIPGFICRNVLSHFPGIIAMHVSRIVHRASPLSIPGMVSPSDVALVPGSGSIAGLKRGMKRCSCSCFEYIA